MNEKIGENQKEALFKRLLAKNDNSVCADCKSKGAAWASLDFGVFVCINCSGVHRSFGMHITRIRSTKLDDWIVCDYKVLETVGNQIANMYWEHGLKNKVTPQSFRSEDERANFIKNKYINKLYVMKGKRDPASVFVDSGYQRKSEDLRAMYEDAAKVEGGQGQALNLKSAPEVGVKVGQNKKEESLIDFGFGEQSAPKSMVPPPKNLQFERAKSANDDPFGFDLFGDSKASKSLEHKPDLGQQTKAPQPVKQHHDFTTSDILFDFTKANTSFPQTTQLTTGNIYNINNLTVYNQNFSGQQPQQSQQSFSNGQMPFTNQNPHLDRYAVFDTFKMNYQHYGGYHN